MALTIAALGLILLGGILPIVGISRLFLHARRSYRSSSGATLGALVDEGEQTGLLDGKVIGELAKAADRAPALEWRRVRNDVFYIGGGILCGTAGSALALFL